MLLDRTDQNAPNQAMIFTGLVSEEKRKETRRKEKLSEVEATFTLIHLSLTILMQS